MHEHQDDPFWIFLHMHKCAGTYVVHAAQRSGFVLPADHRNGNLPEAEGRQVFYAGMPRERLRAILSRERARGTNFLAMEWDFPCIEDFPCDLGLRFLTVLRDPLARARSNFRMDKVNGWCDHPDVTFTGHFDGLWLYRSHDYYTRKLCAAGRHRALRGEDFTRADAVLARFDAVIVLGRDNVDPCLARLGMDQADPGARHALTEAEARRRVPPSRLAIRDEELVEFCGRNAFDVALFSRWAERPLCERFLAGHRRDARAEA